MKEANKPKMLEYRNDLLIGLVSGFIFWACTMTGDILSELAKSNGFVNPTVVVLIKVIVTLIVFFGALIYVDRKFK